MKWRAKERLRGRLRQRGKKKRKPLGPQAAQGHVTRGRVIINYWWDDDLGLQAVLGDRRPLRICTLYKILYGE